MKKYLSLIGISILILVVCWIGYQAFFAYLSEHSYYISMLSSLQNRGIFVSALACAGLVFTYYLMSDKVKIKNLVIALGIGAGVFGLIHSHIKGDPIGFGNIITIFNTLLLFSLGVYLICGFSAIGSWIQRKIIKFNKQNRQEILLSFGLGLCGFIIVVQILLGIGILYGIVSRILFVGLGFMIWTERKQLKVWTRTIESILENLKIGIKSGNWDINSKEFWNGKARFLALLLLIILSLTYVYMGIQNAFTPYSTAWDANHEYMYIPKILAQNAGIYRGNTVANNMPGLWHQFLTFIFSLSGLTGGRFGLSSDNIAISMNNLSALFVLVFGVAIIFQIFNLLNNKNQKESNLELGKGEKYELRESMKNSTGILAGWSILLLWLTSGMGAFLVIVDNKTDLGVMALSLLALLAGLIFLQNFQTSKDKKELLKYIIIAGLFFGFAALAKITAFVDFVLFGILLISLRFSPLISLGLGVIVMGIVRKFNILTASVMLTDNNASWFIIIGLIITVIGFGVYLYKKKNRKDLWNSLSNLLILGICFVVPLVLFKLPRTTISQIKAGNYSLSSSMKSVLLSFDNQERDGYTNAPLLAQSSGSNENYESSAEEISLEEQSIIDESIVNSRENLTFNQCSSEGNIYSESELNEGLQEIIGDGGSEDFGRYIGYGWKQFTNEKNGVFGLLKLMRPTSNTCYGFNHDAKILCNNSEVINSFKIDDLKAIYENGIKNQNSEAGLLLKNAIDKYNELKNEGNTGLSDSKTFYDEIVALRQYYQSHSIYSEEGSVYIPYRYLVPLNISFNRSLQNLSSYYTDIGFVWVIMYILLIISLPYALIKKNKILTSVSLTTLIGRGIWWIIGSAILWYGTVLISWTMITIAIFVSQLFRKENRNHPYILIGTLFAVILITFAVQILFNFLRISSQGANSVFVWYKGNVGSVQIMNENLEYDTKVKYGYVRKNIFDLQFPQYNPIINAISDRDDKDGVIIAGTYIQYFLGNQWNIKSDGMLSDFWKKTSDGDLCKTYWRLKNDNTRYLIIDPNIGTVTMGEGNESLFYRFFGKLNSEKTEIEIDGTVTTLIRLARNGYLKLLSTSNIGSKYAFTLDDDIVREYFGKELSDEELILTRSKMAVLQYFGDANEIFSSIINIFMYRVLSNPKAGIEDIASIYGMEIDGDKVLDVASAYISGNVKEGMIENLTQNERMVLANYLNVYLGYKQNSENLGNMIQNMLAGSVSGGSQIIALELN